MAQKVRNVEGVVKNTKSKFIGKKALVIINQEVKYDYQNRNSLSEIEEMDHEQTSKESLESAISFGDANSSSSSLSSNSILDDGEIKVVSKKILLPVKVQTTS